MPRIPSAIALAGLLASTGALAAPVTYEIDPAHTYPSFEADHMGLSFWRGKFNTTSGEVVLDQEAQTGTVNVVIDINSVDFGHEEMNKKARGEELFNTARFPHATFAGTLGDFADGAPTSLKGNLTLNGVTAPVDLDISHFRCIEHPMLKKEVCGADASGSFQRDTFGLALGKEYGFDMTVNLRIQVEALVKP